MLAFLLSHSRRPCPTTSCYYNFHPTLCVSASQEYKLPERLTGLSDPARFSSSPSHISSSYPGFPAHSTKATIHENTKGTRKHNDPDPPTTTLKAAHLSFCNRTLWHPNCLSHIPLDFPGNPNEQELKSQHTICCCC